MVSVIDELMSKEDWCDGGDDDHNNINNNNILGTRVYRGSRMVRKI